MKPVKLTAELIEAFAGTFLSGRYDDPVATPAFHRVGWAAYCSSHPQVCLVAPREHAKSTALTFAYILAEVLFRCADYVVLVGSTEDMAAEQLSNLREELIDNDDLRREFGIEKVEKDSTTDVIVRCGDGHRFRILARGAEQKIRGKMWNGKRPNLLVGDDMEDDEQVENRDRRAKFRRWFFRAAKQALGRGGRTRVHGTILHEDSLLSRLKRNRVWQFIFLKAHAGFDDFSEILWPEAWPEARLRGRRQEFIEDGDAAGYSQEFLNDPQDHSEAYLRRQDFLPMSQSDRERPKIIYAAADFAVSKEDRANRTSFTIGGKCPFNLIHIVDQRVGRWASLERLADGMLTGWIMEMVLIQRRWNPVYFFVEDGVIWKSIQRIVYNTLREQDCPMNIVEVPSVKDKATRGRTFQKQHRSGMMRFDKETEWYPGYEQECLRFTGNSQATLDDQFDSTSLLCVGYETVKPAVDEEDYMDEEELSLVEMNRRRRGAYGQDGRSMVTGY